MKLRKTQPKISFPHLGITEPTKVAKVLSSPAANATARFRRFKNGVPYSIVGPESAVGPASGWYDPKRQKSYIAGHVDPKRMDAIGAHEEMHDMLDQVEHKHGKMAKRNLMTRLLSVHPDHVVGPIVDALHKLGYNFKDPDFDDEVLNYFHTYMTDPVNRQRIRAEAKSPTHAAMIDRGIKSGWRKMRDIAARTSIHDLVPAHLMQKSLKNEDWAKITRASVPHASAIVDHGFHATEPMKNTAFDSAAAHPDPINTFQDIKGVSPKLVMRNPETGKGSEVAMVKPYHKRSDSIMMRAPISGWATLATRKLFDAAGMGHMVEDVGYGEHQGVPLTVHKFANGYRTMTQLRNDDPKISVDGVDLDRLAVMDFLAGNKDRHAGNLLYHPGEKTEGSTHNKLLALDHERNFQYYDAFGHGLNLNPSQNAEDGEHPRDYMTNSSGITRANERAEGGQAHDLVKWWKDSGPKIKDEMLKQVVAIKDENVRQHVLDNFNRRHAVMDKWSTEQPHQHPLQGYAEDMFVGVSRFPKRYREQTAAARARLPSDPAQAANTIMARSMEKPFPGKSHEFIKELMGELVAEMSPEQTVQFMIHNDRNPAFSAVDMVHDRYSRGGNQQDKERFKTALRSTLSSMPMAKDRFPFLAGAIDQTRKVP